MLPEFHGNTNAAEIQESLQLLERPLDTSSSHGNILEPDVMCDYKEQEPEDSSCPHQKPAEPRATAGKAKTN